MKSLILAGAITSGIATACFADGLYWVVGHRASNRCEIVTSNPVVISDIWLEDGPTNPSTMPSFRVRPSARARRTIGPPADVRLVQNAISAYAVGHRGIDLLQFGFQMLVDQQQGFQRAMDIAIAAGYDLVDSGVFWFGTHRKPFNFPVH
jgi:hypothetical protein